MSSNWDTDWDLSIHNRNGQRILDIEVTTKFNASPEWAARFRRNILAHGTFPKALYFLMVFPDRFYLWSDTDAQSEQSEPTYSIDARPVLQPYFERAGATAEQISSQSLELIIESWFWKIIHRCLCESSGEVSYREGDRAPWEQYHYYVTHPEAARNERAAYLGFRYRLNCFLYLAFS